MSGVGTEAFPELGRHCQHEECRQLDFLPFTCNACRKVFCIEHRSYRSHDCPKSDVSSRKVVVCEVCSGAVETTGRYGDDEKKLLEEHAKSGDCDPRKKKKATCPVRRCREVLTFSNNATCKSCGVRVCLRHRFPTEHTCEKMKGQIGNDGLHRSVNDSKFLAALSSRMGKECNGTDDKHKKMVKAPSQQPSVRAF